ncbi:MAG: FtsQ-type POTRA domain-containing protein, partial [Clostridia bacterium]
KALIIIASTLGALIVLSTILVFTLFAVRDVKIEFQTSLSVLNDVDKQEEILKSADFKLGQSVFFMNKNEYANKMEKANPYVKIINIETVFPNKIVVHCGERESAYLINGENRTYVCDKEMKVLKIHDKKISSTKNNEIMIDGESLIADGCVEGDFIELQQNKLDILKNLVGSLALNNRNLQESKAYFALISLSFKIEPVSASEFIMLTLKNHEGFTYEVFQCEWLLTEKMQKLFAGDCVVPNEKRQTHRMIIYQTSKGVIQASLVQNA